MANIKFSQFTVGNTESDIDFVVGYKGANNIQISPANLLSATLSGYLPLTGGTMTGGITMVDNVGVLFGSGGDSFIKHTGTDMSIYNDVGNINIVNRANDKGIVFHSDNGSGGTTEYFKLNGFAVRTDVLQNFRVQDNIKFQAGSSGDLEIYHDGTNTYFDNEVGDIYFRQNKDNGDVYFQCDNGSGALANYFYLDGSITETRFSKATRHSDNIISKFGDGNDLNILHDSNHSYIKNYTGDLYIENFANDKDIIFKSDNGGGAVTTYFLLDGSLAAGGVPVTRFPDNSKLGFGDSTDLQIYHNGSNDRSYIYNTTGDLYIENDATDGDIKFYSDDGSGGTAQYFRLDGGVVETQFLKSTLHFDNVKAKFGDSNDFQIYHEGTDSIIQNYTGSIYIDNNANNSDIVLRSDDGSGGITNYIQIDGSEGRTLFNKHIRVNDNVQVQVGSDADLKIYHNATNSYIQNDTGDLYIRNNFQDRDIILQSDDGGGGIATYIQVDGSLGISTFYKNLYLPDDVQLRIGTGSDLKIYHNATNSLIENSTGDFYISNKHDDGNIIFFCDDGSGGTAEYFRLDGGTTKIQVNKEMQFYDNVKTTFGFAADLQIYHDGSNSFIDDTGTGILYIRAAANMYFQTYGSGKRWASFFENQGIELFYNDIKKLETRSTGIKISGVSEYADNTAAIAGGLITGDVYRTGDLLKIVH